MLTRILRRNREGNDIGNNLCRTFRTLLFLMIAASSHVPFGQTFIFISAVSAQIATDGTVKSFQKISDTAGSFTATLDNSDFFGVSVASLGDLDGDGVTDLAVGAHFGNDGGANRGAVYVLFLNTDGTVKSFQKISDTAGSFTATLDNSDVFGISVASLGDLDGDAVTDMAVGAYVDDDGGSDRGAVYVLFLNTDGTVKSFQKISDTAGSFTATLDDVDLFGSSVASLGDLDGDGVSDLAVGAVFDGDGGENRGAVYSLFLKAEATASTVTTGAATNVSTTSATLNGTVNPNNLSTTVTFEWGETTSYGNTITADQSPVTGTTDVAVSANLTGLSESTEYHFRVVATNSAGTTNGGDQTFTTTLAGTAPTATTDTATNVSTTSATLNGTVNPNNLSTTLTFEWGQTTTYGNTVTADQSPVTGTSDVSVSATLTELSDNTEYHFRAVATNSAGTTNGGDQTFTTTLAGTAPTAATDAATNVSTTSATLNGTVNPNNLSTTVTFEWGETTSYGNTVTADQSPVTGTSDVSVSATLTELSDNTEYHFRAVATNSAGTTNGGDQTFATLQAGSAPTAITIPATDIGTTSATLNGIVNPNDPLTTVTFEYGETEGYGSTSTADQSPLTGTVDLTVSTNIMDLLSNTEYHFRVVATNDVGTTNGGDRMFSTLELAPPVISGSLQGIVASEGELVTVNVQIAAEAGLNRAELKYFIGGTKTLRTSAFSDVGGNQYQALIPPEHVTDRGIVGFIQAEDNLGRVAVSDTAEIRVHFDDIGISRVSTEQYAMISVPGDLDGKNQTPVLGDELGVYDKTRWRLFGWNGTNYTEFEGSANFNPGAAFWIITAKGANLSGGPGTSTQLMPAHSIGLNQGWNQIGSPYNFDVDVGQMKYDPAAIEPQFYEYDPAINDYVIQTSMKPGGGVWIYAFQNTALQVNSGTGSLARQVVETLPLQWGGRAKATVGHMQDTENAFGVASMASDAWDESDRHEPPVIGDYVTLAFDNREWDYRGGLYSRDIRSQEAQGHVWPFVVRTNHEGYVHLDFEWTEAVPPGWEAHVVDRDLEVVRTLSEVPQYTFRSNGSKTQRNFSLVVGQPSFVREAIEEFVTVPEEYELFQNMPNPFNAVTTIRFSLPEEGKVNLVIYDVMGHEVVTLSKEERYDRGIHISLWNGKNRYGRNVGTGVYLYRIQAGDFIQSRKMVLLR
ncbi:MAG: T9SS type A sorting domain-containing protein [Candidatus Neomarinimicrobiota bacterium]